MALCSRCGCDTVAPLTGDLVSPPQERAMPKSLAAVVAELEAGQLRSAGCRRQQSDSETARRLTAEQPASAARGWQPLAGPKPPSLQAPGFRFSWHGGPRGPPA